MSKVDVNLRGLKALQKTLPKFADDLMKEIAQATPENIILSILRGQTGLDDTRSLPANEISTINRKRSQGKPPSPLIDNKQIINKRNWRVFRSKNGYKIKLKEIRNRISYYLHQGVQSKRGLKKYPFLLKPTKYTPRWITLIMKQKVNKYFRNFK